MKAPDEPKLGARVHVRCICGDEHCRAPAGTGGRAGELVDKQDELWSVHLDGDDYALDFPRFAVKVEH